MKRLGIVLAMIVLLSGCHVKENIAVETVADEFGPAKSRPYRIVFEVPEGAVRETFGDGEDFAVYTAENGDYRITTEVLAVGDAEVAMETVSGIPADRLAVIELERSPMKEYQFAWSSAGEEEETISRAALVATQDYCYVLTMTQRVSLGENYRELTDSVFSTWGLSVEDTL